MGKRKFITIEDCNALAAAKDGYCLSTKYINYSSKLLWMCAKGHKWYSAMSSVKAYSAWCPKCAHINRPRGKSKHRLADCQNAAIAHGGRCLETGDTPDYFVNRKISLICHEGHKWSATVDSLLFGHWCNMCAHRNKGRRRLTINDCRVAAAKHSGWCLSNIYIDAQHKLRWRCKNGHEWDALIDPIRNKNVWCKSCSASKYSISDCHNAAQAREGKCISTHYTSNDAKYKWECSKGHQWEARFCNIQEGQWCKQCSRGRRQGDLLKIIKCIFDEEILSDNRSLGLINPDTGKQLEIDIFVPSVKLAIEYDGRQHFEPVHYFGGQAAFDGIIKRDALKNRLVEESSIINKLIRFGYKEKITKEYVMQKLLDNGISLGGTHGI